MGNSISNISGGCEKPRKIKNLKSIGHIEIWYDDNFDTYKITINELYVGDIECLKYLHIKKNIVVNEIYNKYTHFHSEIMKKTSLSFDELIAKNDIMHQYIEILKNIETYTIDDKRNWIYRIYKKVNKLGFYIIFF